MKQRVEFRLTPEQQENLEAIFAYINEDARLDVVENPKESLNALLTILRKRLSERMDAYAPLKSAIQEASGTLLPLTIERRRRAS